jgi:hypothetical protein
MVRKFRRGDCSGMPYRDCLFPLQVMHEIAVADPISARLQFGGARLQIGIARTRKVEWIRIVDEQSLVVVVISHDQRHVL